MAHRRTFSARFPSDMRNVSLDDPPLTPIPNIGVFSMSSRKPRAYWYRTTFLALFVLIVISVYVVFVSQPALRPISFLDVDRPRADDAASRPSRWSSEAIRIAALRHRKPNTTSDPANARPQISLNQTEELAAVSGFIASLPQNVIPSTVDPSKPIDPQLILDFDTRGPHAQAELQNVVRDVWVQNPVMLYSKYHSPVSREIKQILDSLYLKPAPTVVEVDQRPDENVLMPLLFRLTSTTELPILLVGGRVIGAPKEIKYLATTGVLQQAITDAGAIVDGARRKRPKKL